MGSGRVGTGVDPEPAATEVSRPEGWSPVGSTPYDVFLSYSHDDRLVAMQIQRALQRFARPWRKRRALRVFRDESHLGATPGLVSELERVIRESRVMILVASPASAASPWVEQELRLWLATHGQKNLLLAQVDGVIDFEDVSGRVDLSVTDAIPVMLAQQLAEEPLVVDFRACPRKPDGTFRDDIELTGRIADLAAFVHDRDRDELIGDDLAEHRRARRARRLAVAGLAVLTALALLAASVARVQRDEARDQRLIASSRSLLLPATEQLQAGHLDVGAWLAMEAAHRNDNALTRDVLYRANDEVGRGVERIMRFTALANPLSFNRSALSRDGRWLVAGTKPVQLIDLSRPDQPPVLLTCMEREADDLAVSTSGHVLLLSLAGDVRVWDPGGTEIPDLTFDQRPGCEAPAGTGNVGTACADYRVTHRRALSSPDGYSFAYMTTPGGVRFVDAVAGSLLADRAGFLDTDPDRQAFSPTGRFAIGRLDPTNPDAVLWDLRSGAEARPVTGPSGPLHHVAFSDDERVVLAAGGTGVYAVDPATGRAQGTPIDTGARVDGLALDRAGTTAAALGPAGRVALIDLATGAVRVVESGQPDAGGSRFSRSGRTLLIRAAERDTCATTRLTQFVDVATLAVRGSVATRLAAVTDDESLAFVDGAKALALIPPALVGARVEVPTVIGVREEGPSSRELWDGTAVRYGRSVVDLSDGSIATPGMGTRRYEAYFDLPDGRLVGADGTGVVVWHRDQLAAGELLAPETALTRAHYRQKVALSDDLKVRATRAAPSVIDIGAGAPDRSGTRSIDVQHPVDAFVLSPDGTRLAASYGVAADDPRGFRIGVWDVTDGRKRFEVPCGMTTSELDVMPCQPGFVAGGRELTYVNIDKKVTVSAEDGVPLPLPDGAAVADDGTVVAISGTGAVTVSPADGTPARTLAVEVGSGTSRVIAIRPSAGLFAVLLTRPDRTEVLRIHRLADGALVSEVDAPGGQLRLPLTTAFDPTGRWFLADDRLFDVASGRQLGPELTGLNPSDTPARFAEVGEPAIIVGASLHALSIPAITERLCAVIAQPVAADEWRRLGLPGESAQPCG